MMCNAKPSDISGFRLPAIVIDRNATRRVPQMSAILLHQGQAGEIAKIQLPCVCMPCSSSPNPDSVNT